MMPMNGAGAAFGGARTTPMQAQPIRGDAGVPISPAPRDAGAGGGARDAGTGGGARDAGTGGTRGDAGVGTAPRGDGGVR